MEPDKMDVDQTGASTSRGQKRDYDTMSEGGEGTMQLDPQMKASCYKTIVHTFLFIAEYAQLKLKVEDIKPYISTCADIASIIQTCHTILRQEINRQTSFSEKHAGSEGTINHLGNPVTISYKTVKLLMVAVAAEYGLDYKTGKTTDGKMFIGTMAPLISFISAFKARFKEMRAGFKEFYVSADKAGDPKRLVKARDYGIKPVHYILCEGLTFSPTLRTAMAQSLGPLTTLVMLSQTKEFKFQKKWKSAAERAFRQFSYIDNALEKVKGSPASNIAHLISAAGDLALITTTRDSTRAYVPINMLASVFADFNKVGAKGEIKVDDKTFTVKAFGWNELALDHFNSSGQGLFAAYKEISKEDWYLTSKLEASDAKQAVFHAIFGTYREDLSILASITDIATWKTRSGFGKKFQSMGKCTSAYAVQAATNALLEQTESCFADKHAVWWGSANNGHSCILWKEKCYPQPGVF